MTRLVLMGPPGVGKGTQAAILATRLGIPHITTGQLLRDEIERGTALGREVAHHVAAGTYIPDELASELLARRIAAGDADHGWVLDGYPRTREQVDALDAALALDGHVLDRVLLLHAADDTVMARIAGRADQGRSDDGDDVVRRRLDVYLALTAEVAEEYGRRGVLRRVSAEGTKEEVTDAVFETLSLSPVTW